MAVAEKHHGGWQPSSSKLKRKSRYQRCVNSHRLGTPATSDAKARRPSRPMRIHAVADKLHAVPGNHYAVAETPPAVAEKHCAVAEKHHPVPIDIKTWRLRKNTMVVGKRNTTGCGRTP